jgi:uncharacterized membrane protein
VDPYLNEWLDLLLRWLHVVAGIAWIGSSFYFIALDLHLLPPREKRDRDRGVGGEAWEVHGGGFYHVQKYRVAPETLPEPIHWFKWEAYTTWLSGFALMVVLYYVNADVYLIDRSVADLSEAQAIGLSVALLLAAWLVYDGLCRLLGDRGFVLAAVLAGLVAATTYGVGELYSGRGAFLQVGAMLGTIMVANVLFVIMPGHWELVRAKQAGREPDPVWGLLGKQRSVHNNYLTLPVVVAMISNHFPAAYGHEHGWAILIALMAVGAWIRLFFNLHHRGENHPVILVTAALALVVIAVTARPDERGSNADRSAEPVPFARVEQIVQRRCVSCHSAEPTNPSVGTAPKGVELDDPGEIAARADEIERVAVDSSAMPPGNLTGMREAERDLLGAWIRQGAQTRRTR